MFDKFQNCAERRETPRHRFLFCKLLVVEPQAYRISHVISKRESRVVNPFETIVEEDNTYLACDAPNVPRY